MKRILLIIFLVCVVISCSREKQPIEISSEDFHASVDKVTEVMVHDIFSPPVASRIYTYPNVGAYEILAKNDENYQSLAGQLTGLERIPEPQSENINFELAALIAHMDLSRMLIFSEEMITSYRDSLYTVWENTNKEVYSASKQYGLQVSEHIASWMDKDNYKQTRTMPKFSVNTDEPSRWQPTPPAYMDGIEPHWNKIRPF